jgi:hypothetical protein
MVINGKVHCFFEQSGTFKNEFIKLGIPAEDYDIQNNFGETDHIVDLFDHIEREYDKTRQDKTIFDNIGKEDLIIAFFPCIYFCAMSQMAFSFGYTNYRKMNVQQKTDAILERSHNRERFFRIAVKMASIAYQKDLRMIMENPWAEQTFLKANFIKAPDVVDENRTIRGDYFKKPTAYWFFNCKPTNGLTIQNDKIIKTILNTKASGQAGLCSEDRSMISPDYARNWICDFILGKRQEIGQLSLF